METLKKVSFILLFVSIQITIHSQNNYKNIEEAFATSYYYETSGDYTKALQSLKAIYDEKSYEINLRMGWLNYMLGNFTDAQAYYQKASKLLPLSLEAKFGIINTSAALGNWEQVKNEYINILKIDPKNTLANYRLGLIYYGKKEYQNAYKHFENNVNLYPFDYDSMIMFAWTNYFLGKTREAKVLFHKCLLMKPNDPSANEGLSLIK